MPKQKQHTVEITQRFLEIMYEVIKAGFTKNKTSFCKSVGEYQQNIANMEAGTRVPTLQNLVNACQVYGYNANWLLLNIGDKKLKQSEAKPLEARVNELETEVARIARLLRVKYTPEFKKQLEERHSNYKNGGKMVSADEGDKQIKKILKKK